MDRPFINAIPTISSQTLDSHPSVLQNTKAPKWLAYKQLVLMPCEVLVCTFFLTGQTYAACTPVGRSLPSNTSVACTGADTVGSRAGTGTTNVSITVGNSATVTRSQGDVSSVLSVFSNSRITNNGLLSSNGELAYAIEGRGSGNTLINNGNVTTSGDFAYGMAIVDGSGSTAENNGSIVTTGEAAFGVLIDLGSGNLATNNGSIMTSGQDADGFHILGTGNQAINNGEINLVGIESDGMDAVGSGHRLVNTGTITTNPPPASNQDSDGMAVEGNDNTLVNSGTVTVNGLDSNAFDIEGNGNQATNSGTLTALGPNGAAIYIDGADNAVTNSGTVQAQGATGNAVWVNSAAGEGNTIINTADGTLSSQQNIAVLGLAGDETLDNAGQVTSGAGPAVDLGAGNDRLIMRDGSLEGSGAVAVNLGTGDDTMDVLGGVVMGAVDQGDGADRFTISAGSVTGAVQQGNGIDDFVMSGGQIQSLAQGDGRDTFLMTDGVIVGAFEDGDVATMTGGTIGRVDMKLDNNIFDMSGGSILGNLVTGFGMDAVTISGGSIGGNISVSGGDDSITVSGGVIAGQIRASTGNDVFNWLNGGQIHSAVLMGDGDDSARLVGLDEGLLALTPSLDGGLGNDQLTFDNTTSANAGRYLGWESVSLGNNSHLDLSGNFFLGDSDSGTGSMYIDSSSVLRVDQGHIRPYTAGQQVRLDNAGTIDMTGGSNSAGDSLTVHGDYIGSNGRLLLQTVLGADNSASDKLVVSQGTISGNTQLGVTNLGGLGGLTRDSGIQVVQAVNGAVSSSNAFALNGSVSAGAYEYYLFKGGVTANTENNWYLRSSVVAVVPPTTPPEPPVTPPVTPVDPTPVTPPVVDPDEPPVEPPTAQPVAPVEPPAPPPGQGPAITSPVPGTTTPPVPDAVPGAEPIPLYRQEVPVYSVVIPSAQIMTMAALGTFHDRQGEQSLLTETGAVGAGWGRVYGRDFNRSWSGTVSPSFDGSLEGFQVGHDLYAAETSAGLYQRFGLFIGRSRLDGDVKGFAEGFEHHDSGRVKLDGDNVGAYWTLSAPVGWYVDLVAMGTRLVGDSRSDRGVKLNTKGDALALSAEAGYPFAVSDSWVVEPQVQVVHQQMNLDSQHDGISHVAFDSQDYWTGRLGARLKGLYRVDNMPVEPYVRANAWRTFGGKDTVTYNHLDRIKSEHESSSADIGIGVVVQVSSTVSVYLAADYTSNLDANELEGVSGNLGLRMSW